MDSLKLTVTESIRYRGRSGHYSWIAHRISGLAILGFLMIHVVDTANAHFYPYLYAWSIDLFKHPFFGLGEIAVAGAVLFHAFNGTRIALLDFRPEWWKYQTQSATAVWVLFLVLFIPLALWLTLSIGTHCTALSAAGDSCWTIPSLADYSPN
ncbi:MAG TPA: succinate dehydrogenase, cytochrome b556 subunit [Anaerolineae bacterium]|nr:succinate dehydrogenase, cytochrome b556 subunit [Anaerolineae bacterium]